MCSSCERTYHSFDIDYIIMRSIKIESNHLFRRLFVSQTRKKVYRVWDVVIFFEFESSIFSGQMICFLEHKQKSAAIIRIEHWHRRKHT